MRKTQIIYYAGVILFLLLGCKQHNEVVYERTSGNGREFIKKKTYSKKGKIMVEEVLNKDSIRDGQYKEWVSDKPSLIGNYVLGKKEGTWFYMDLLGDTIKIENWFDGKRFGEQVEFFSRVRSSGRPLVYRYVFTGLDEKELFTAVFNTDEKIESIKGIPLYCAYNKDNLRTGDQYEMVCFFGIPKHFSFNLIIEELDLQNIKVLYSKSINRLDINDLESVDFGKKVSIDKKYTSRGNFVWKMKLSLKNKDKVLIMDSVTINVAVKDP